jgi:hypothetical protein
MEISKIIEKNSTEPLAARKKCGYPINSHTADKSYMHLEKPLTGYPHPTQSHTNLGGAKFGAPKEIQGKA